MLHDFPNSDTLPGPPRTGRPPTDASTYSQLNEIAKILIDTCINIKGEAGWRAGGQRVGIGIFVWSTNSEQDIEIENDENSAKFVFPTLEMIGNGSAAAW